MKGVLLAAGLSFVLGLAAAFTVTNGHYQRQLDKIELKRLEAQDAQQKTVDELAVKYKGLLQAANNRDPIIRTERVLVSATCPVPTTNGAGVGDGETTGRSELAPTTVRSIDRVINKTEVTWGGCEKRLSFFQELARANGWRITN